MSEVKFKVPDFTDPETGVEYSEIEVVVMSDGDDLREAASLAGSLERSLDGHKKSPQD